MKSNNNQMSRILFTSESVAPGHPDKICDQISDAILDAILAIDSNAKVACEVFITSNYLVIGGEVHSDKLPLINIKKLAREQATKILIELGYDHKANGFDVKDCQIEVLIHEQSPDILQGVELKNHQIGAGDQGIMFGYACSQTENYMPLAIVLAHALLKRASELQKSGQFKFAKADMKAQVTIDETNPSQLKIDTILMSIQHDINYDEANFKQYIHDEIMLHVIQKFQLNQNFTTLINPTGQFVTGGPMGDTGLTGRKIVVDTYGGAACHGGGAFSGKDPTKVDRTAAYYARYIAKNIVAAGLASKCEVQLAYAIGMTKPISIYVDTHQTLVPYLHERDLVTIITNHFDCTIEAMIKQLNLRNIRYLPLATYGHFGRDDHPWPWEKLDQVKILQKYLQNNK